MHLSSSAVMSSSYLSKAQVNNFVDYTPPKSSFKTSTEISPDLLARSSMQFSLTGQKLSPELESLRRDFNDQLRNLFYTLTGDVNALKKNNSENKIQIDELRRELDIANSKILQNKNANASELNFIKETVLSNKDSNTKGFQLDETVRGSWARHDVKSHHDYSSDISNINERIAQISRQLNGVNEELEATRKASYVPKDQFNKTMGDFIDELERKLSIINERVRERIEEMDSNLVRSLKDKEQDFNKLYYDIRSVQSSMIRVSDQVNTFTHSAEVNLEAQVKKIIHGYHVELKNLSSMASTIEMKAKMMKKDESMMMGSGLQQPQFQHRETDSKYKELDTIYQSIMLLEKEMRSKVDMVDLNVNSIKRNLELELSIQMKNMILPLQNNIEQYLLSSENRFVALEDAVLNHMKRESYVMPPERTSKLRDTTMHFRDSPFVEDRHPAYTNKPAFENISNIEPVRQSRSEKKQTGTNRKLSYGSDTKEKVREKEKEKEKEKHFTEAYKVDEADSVVSVSQTVQSHNLKGEWRYNQPEEKSFEDPSYHAESPHDLSHNVIQEDEDPEVEVGELEDEAPAINAAKKINSDQDRNKKQRNAEIAFKNLEPLSQPDTMFRDFPSVCAFKSHMEEHHPGRQDRPSSSKKKKPEIELHDTANKGNTRETPKKSSSKTSPLNIDSRLALGSEDFSEEEPSPIVKKPSIEAKEKKPLERGREAPEMLGDAINEDFQGGVKGLLSKARNKRESTPTLEEEDYRPNRGKSAQKGKHEENYGREQSSEDRFKRNMPLPNKGLERSNSRDSGKVQQKPALPPVDTKNMKNFNKSAGLKPPQGKNNMNARQNNNFRGGNARAMQNLDEEEEDVEEIVYHVDEEGFLIDEQGNYLVDEQGNFLQLSPEQMREIEDNDLVYEKDV